MELYLVRHGQSLGNTCLDQDLPDSPLTGLGKDQAAYAALKLRSMGITRIISSPLLRALGTAQPLAIATKLPIEVWKSLYEYRKEPSFRGSSQKDVWKIFPEIADKNDLDPEGRHYPGDETPDSVMERALQVVSSLKELDSSEHVALFAHGMFNAYILRAVLQMGSHVSIRQDNSCINWLTFNEDKVVLKRLNDISHLSLSTSGT
jgi:broad specificity phosphatase PhoE